MRFTPDGVGSVFASTGLTGPIGLAFDADGDLYVSHRPPGVRGAIMKFTPAKPPLTGETPSG